MEETELKQKKGALINGLIKAYAVLATTSFFLILGVFWANYLESEVKSYCIPVSAEQPHDFKMSESNACLIDWWAVIKEPVFISALFLCALIVPIFALKILKNKMS